MPGAAGTVARFSEPGTSPGPFLRVMRRIPVRFGRMRPFSESRKLS
jgi:hypothetical protein